MNDRPHSDGTDVDAFGFLVGTTVIGAGLLYAYLRLHAEGYGAAGAILLFLLPTAWLWLLSLWFNIDKLRWRWRNRKERQRTLRGHGSRAAATAGTSAEFHHQLVARFAPHHPLAAREQEREGALHVERQAVLGDPVEFVEHFRRPAGRRQARRGWRPPSRNC